MSTYTIKNIPYKGSPVPVRRKAVHRFRSHSDREHRSGSTFVNYVIDNSTPPSNRRRIRSDPESWQQEGCSRSLTKPNRTLSFSHHRERTFDRSKTIWRSKSVSVNRGSREYRHFDYIRTVSEDVDSSIPNEDNDSTKGVVDKWRSYKRILFKQISDSAILSRKKQRMTQETQQLQKMPSPHVQRRQLDDNRLESEVANNSPSKTTPSAKALSHLQHPRKKFIRTQSESAIDVSNIRNRKTSQPCGPDLKGVVCTSDDLKQILMDARRFDFSRHRNNTITSKFNVLPELKETSFDSKLSKRRKSPPPDLNITWSKSSPRKVSDNIDFSSPVKVTSRTRKTSLNLVSPSILSKNETDSVCLHSTKDWTMSSLNECGDCCTEGTTMLHHDENCNISRMRDDPPLSPTPEEKEELVVTPEKDPLLSLAESFAGFDPQLLGEAIERRLAVSEKQQHTPKKSPTNSPQVRKSPQSFRALWGQNNTQLSNRLGTLVSKFPFKKEESQSSSSSISV